MTSPAPSAGLLSVARNDPGLATVVVKILVQVSHRDAGTWLFEPSHWPLRVCTGRKLELGARARHWTQSGVRVLSHMPTPLMPFMLCLISSQISLPPIHPVFLSLLFSFSTILIFSFFHFPFVLLYFLSQTTTKTHCPAPECKHLWMWPTWDEPVTRSLLHGHIGDNVNIWRIGQFRRMNWFLLPVVHYSSFNYVTEYLNVVNHHFRSWNAIENKINERSDIWQRMNKYILNTRALKIITSVIEN